MACDRCRDPNRVDLQEYKLTKKAANGKETTAGRVLCGSCAQITKDAGFKLTGGKVPEAEPSAPGPEVKEEMAETNDEPARRRRY